MCRRTRGRLSISIRIRRLLIPRSASCTRYFWRWSEAEAAHAIVVGVEFQRSRGAAFLCSLPVVSRPVSRGDTDGEADFSSSIRLCRIPKATHRSTTSGSPTCTPATSTQHSKFSTSSWLLTPRLYPADQPRFCASAPRGHPGGRTRVPSCRRMSRAKPSTPPLVASLAYRFLGIRPRERGNVVVRTSFRKPCGRRVHRRRHLGTRLFGHRRGAAGTGITR